MNNLATESFYQGLLSGENEEILTPEEYLKLFAKFKDKIKIVELIPTEIGKEGFGTFKVTFCMKD